MSQKVFRYEWSGINTGWDYRLTFFKASTEVLATPIYIDLPAGCMNCNKLDEGFDKYLIGASEIPALELEVFTDCLTDDIDAEFYEILYNPKVDMTVPLAFSMKVEAGTIIKLEIKHIGQDESNTWRCYFIGIYNAFTHKYSDSERNIVKITAYHYLKTVLNSVNFTSLWFWAQLYALEYGSEVRDCLFEYAYSSSGINYCAGHQQDNIEMLFYRYSVIEDYIKTFAESVVKLLLRDTSATLSISFPDPKYYKQTYTGSGNLGAEISKSDLYVLAVVTDTEENQSITGLMRPYAYGDKGTLEGMFPNSVWDFLTELCDETGTKLFFPYPGTITFLPIYGSISELMTAELTLNKMNNYELSQIDNSDLINTVTASLHESIKDEDYSDIESYIKTRPGSRNEGEYSIPIIFNNMPSCVEYKNNSGNTFTWFHLKYPAYECRSFYPHINNLYYFDKPALILDGADTQAFRVHEYFDFGIGNDSLGDYRYASELSNCELREWLISAFDPYEASEAILALQKDDSTYSGCKPHQVARAFLELLGKSNTFKLEFEIDFAELTSYPGGGGIGFPWRRFDIEFQLDTAEINSHIPNTYNKWHLLTYELDFNREVAKVQLILKTI